MTKPAAPVGWINSIVYCENYNNCCSMFKYHIVSNIPNPYQFSGTLIPRSTSSTVAAMMTQASLFVLILATSTNSKTQRFSEKLSGECAEGPGWSSSGSPTATDAGDQPRYTFYNRDLTLDLDRHLLSWTHLVQRSPFTPKSQLTSFHCHQILYFSGRSVYKE